MIDLNDEVLIDFLAEVEDYYGKVSAGIVEIRSGNRGEGFHAILRAVHTIKGTAGFIPGLEKIQEFSHAVETQLKKAQELPAAPLPEEISRITQALDEIFNLFEQIRNGHRELDDSAARASLKALAEGGAPPPATEQCPPFAVPKQWPARAQAAGGEMEVAIENVQGAVILMPGAARLHQPRHYQALSRALGAMSPHDRVGLDLSGVRTISSSAWGEIWEMSRRCRLALIGMREAVAASFAVWALENSIASYPDRESFLMDAVNA